MAYVIYRKDTSALVSTLRDKRYKTHAAAKAALTRFNTQWAKTRGKLGNEPDAPYFTCGIAEVEYYAKHIEKTVTRVNMMSGVEYTESVNTPIYMSPSSETYWSM
jgi:acetate kinase